MSKKEAYQKQLNGQLEEWSAAIEKYRARAKQASGKAQVRYQQQIDELEAQLGTAKEKLDDLSDKSEDAWQDMKAGMDSAWHSLGNAMRSAASRFDD